MKARIYKPSKNVMQSGRAVTGQWVLEYERETARTPEPLMGWVSSDDTLNQVRLRFATVEEAVQFAQAQGFEYIVSRPKERIITPRSYMDNFSKKPTKTRA